MVLPPGFVACPVVADAPVKSTSGYHDEPRHGPKQFCTLLGGEKIELTRLNVSVTSLATVIVPPELYGAPDDKVTWVLADSPARSPVAGVVSVTVAPAKSRATSTDAPVISYAEPFHLKSAATILPCVGTVL